MSQPIVGFAVVAALVAAAPPEKPVDEAVRQSLSLQKESTAEAKERYREYREMIRQAAFEGAEFLERQQLFDGTFRYGWLPAINEVMPGNHALRQAGSAALLARAGSRLKHPSFTRAAVVAVRALIAKTTEIDANDSTIRRPSMPPNEANPVGLAALLLWACSEIDDAPADVQADADKLANFLRKRQRKDGSIDVSNSFRGDGDDPPSAQAYYPGEALYAVVRSHHRKPEPWKLDFVRKSLPYYRNYWQDQPHEAFPPWMCSAFGEFFLVTGDVESADLVLEMADWCLALQHNGPREVDRGWQGGFGSFQQNQFFALEPGITTASFSEGIADAYRVAVKRKDGTRAQQYRRALDNAAPFLLTLQFTPQRTRHFTKEVGAQFLGGFRASLSDGSIRIDHNQHAVNALLQYLEFVAVSETKAAEPRAN